MKSLVDLLPIRLTWAHSWMMGEYLCVVAGCGFAQLQGTCDVGAQETETMRDRLPHPFIQSMCPFI